MANISSSDKTFATQHGCAAIAVAVYHQTKWPIVILTYGDGSGWVHAANKLPNGNVIDVNGSSHEGSHIINDDMYYDAVDDDDFDGEFYMDEAPIDMFDLSEYTNAELTLSVKIASKLVKKYNT
jgi:hypothetical protein